MMVFSEKVDWINKEFQRSKLVLMGRVPEDIADAKDWYNEARRNADEFINRYQSKGTSVRWYVQLIVDDYMHSIDREYEEKLAPVHQSHLEDIEALRKQLMAKLTGDNLSEKEPTGERE